MISFQRRQTIRISDDSDVPCVIHGYEQIQILGINPPHAFRCGGHIYVKSSSIHENNILNREWESGGINPGTMSINDASI